LMTISRNESSELRDGLGAIRLTKGLPSSADRQRLVPDKEAPTRNAISWRLQFEEEGAAKWQRSKPDFGGGTPKVYLVHPFVRGVEFKPIEIADAYPELHRCY